MKFYIVTPTFNSWSWLQACIKSVADQATGDLEVHHHVQDGGSSDGTPERLAQWQQQSAGLKGYSFTYVSAQDAGMYDAINLAWAQMPKDADFTAHLNSDEQYLPEALAQVARYFERYKRAEILLGSYIILDADLRYIAHRRPVTPQYWSSVLHCNCITNSTFYRAELFPKHKIAYNTRWRIVGDMVLYRELLEKKLRFKTIPLMSSTFVCTGENLAWSRKCWEEWSSLVAEAPRLYQRLDKIPHYWVNICRRVSNCFLPTPTSYSLFCAGEDVRRQVNILKPTCRWKARRTAHEGSCDL
ncbi:MAG: glycosyltransferase [Akkermansia sp.]